MLLSRNYGACLLLFLLSSTLFDPSTSQLDFPWAAKKRHMREKVRKMFYHAYENYMKHAFPHDELKPLTKSFTDSLSELGNLKLEHLPENYNGSALSLIESLSSLVIMGNNTEFYLFFEISLSSHDLLNPKCSLILEMGALSRLAGDPRYESAALRALRKLWSMRSSLNLLGTTLDVTTGEWIEYSSGIGAGVDSFYEYLLKAYILFGKEDYWRMFQSAYLAVQKYFRHGPWYHEVDMRTGKATYWQLTSLQAFWPGLQATANSSHREFVHVWKKFGVIPERYLLDHQMLHPTEKYYPLQPELAESTFYLYQATKDPWYIQVGESIVNSLNSYTKVEGGFASGHPLPILSSWHERLPETYIPTNWTYAKNEQQTRRASAMSLRECPAMALRSGYSVQQIESACHIPDTRADHRCFDDEECGVDSTTCRRRSCSMACYCGLWIL
ncbi:putative alpha-mannosidase I MNS5 [Hibiscus syriacus]|uniref:Alpha-mannosidase I MNS5 n=1 Tax=Hibiscus syriacus TaxID=106335 RepID=A0A6A3C7Y4_HIBSY|nr:putative alpha-mannosidase I MNS5 [Hibiscus syriacus]